MAPEAQSSDRLGYRFYHWLEPVLPCVLSEVSTARPRTSSCRPGRSLKSLRHSHGVPDLREDFNKARYISPSPSTLKLRYRPSTTPLRGWLYSLSGPKTKTMERYIEDSVAEGSICPFAFPAGAGFSLWRRRTKPYTRVSSNGATFLG